MENQHLLSVLENSVSFLRIVLVQKKKVQLFKYLGYFEVSKVRPLNNSCVKVNTLICFMLIQILRIIQCVS